MSPDLSHSRVELGLVLMHLLPLSELCLGPMDPCPNPSHKIIKLVQV